jgi:peptide/nickel transport system substrate-binding protein
MKFSPPICAVAVAALMAASASAETLRWARPQEALTLDPHSQNEGPTTTFLRQIYEPLIIRDMTGQLTPGLATAWAPSPDDGTVWVFDIRQGVTFHDGTPLTAEVVKGSLDRFLDIDRRQDG